MAHILVTHGIPDEAFVILEGHRVSQPPKWQTFPRDEMLSLLSDTDAILACGAVTAEMIGAASNLKIISNYGAGYEKIDVAAATKRGIPVTNCPDSTAIPTAEIAIGLILSCARRIGELDRKIREVPPEELFGMGRYMGMSLSGRTLGIIGMGHIGSCVAAFGRLIGMRVVYYNRHQLPKDREQGAQHLPLEELLQSSDIVSIHCPLTEETHNLLSSSRLALLKSSAILVNTARAAIVDYDALTMMLKEGRLKGAGLDVFPKEPHVPADLLTLEQVVLTPHIGTNTREARFSMAKDACLRILDALSGKRPPNVVNPEIYA